MRRTLLTITIAGLILTAGCSVPGDGSPGATTSPSTTTAPVLFVGDSIATGQALPLAAAFAETDVEFRSLASEGGGNVVGPGSEQRWAELPVAIAEAAPAAVVYQVTTYDWGAEEEQREAYTRLVDTVDAAGADLVFVDMPPIRPDEFYAPHMAQLERASQVAAEVAGSSGGRAVRLDSSEVWGAEYREQRDGIADRSSDGIHTCPQSAARFAAWLTRELEAVLPGFSAPDPASWAGGEWARDRHFMGC
ncbi:SGNH/GDSL hydrolase family protein [Pseudonocardia sp. NPDC049635]|uniref:SGNH/GDSL hydrolase family protein n=1 Tax=Pseudonocardia sp. NPDC049635 TaxID=3155506 RepID=UPI0033C3D047